MSTRTLLYACTRGGLWFWCHGNDLAEVLIPHVPYATSGEVPKRIELVDFLSKGAGSFEHAALLGMIGSLGRIGRSAMPGPDGVPEPDGRPPTPP